MFTIEMDWDETAITILDPDGEYEDLDDNDDRKI